MTICRWASRVACAVAAAIGAALLITAFSPNLRKATHDDAFPALSHLWHARDGLRRWLSDAMAPESLEGGMILFPVVPVYEEPQPNASANASLNLAPESLAGGMILFPPTALKEKAQEAGQDDTTIPPWESLGGGMALFPPMQLDDSTASGIESAGMALFPPVYVTGLAWNETTKAPTPAPTPAPVPTPAPTPAPTDLDDASASDNSTDNTTTTTSSTTSSTTTQTTTSTTTTVTTLLTSTSTSVTTTSLGGTWPLMDTNKDGSITLAEFTANSQHLPQVLTATLSTSVTAGATTIPLTDTTGWSPGMLISFFEGSNNETATILSVTNSRLLSGFSDGRRRLAAGSVTIDTPLANNYSLAATASQASSFSDIDVNGDNLITQSEYLSWEQSLVLVKDSTTTTTTAIAAAEDDDSDDGPWWFWLVVIVVILIVAWICFVCTTKSVLHILEQRKKQGSQEEQLPLKDSGLNKDEEVINIGGPPSQAAPHEVVPERREEPGCSSEQSEIFISGKDEAKADEAPAPPEKEPEERDKEPEEAAAPRELEPLVDTQARSFGEATAPIAKEEESAESKKPPLPPPEPPPVPGPFMQSFDKDYYAQHALRSVSGRALEAVNCAPYQEYHRGVAENRLQAAVEADSLSELTAAIALAKTQAVPTDLVWYAEVCRRRRAAVAELQDIVENLTGKRASAKLWRTLWAKKMIVLQDLLEQARKDADSVLRELQAQQ